MRYVFVIIILLASVSAYSQPGVKGEDWSNLKKLDFDSLVNDLKIDISIPTNFSEASIVENPNVLYNKAFSHDNSGFEIRVWIRDLRNEQKPAGLSADQLSKTFLTMMSLNASGYVLPDMPQIMVFDSQISHSEFNADWVAGTSFLPNLNDFNKGFEACSIIGMRKNDQAEVYVFLMISNREKEEHLIAKSSQVVTFR